MTRLIIDRAQRERSTQIFAEAPSRGSQGTDGELPDPPNPAPRELGADRYQQAHDLLTPGTAEHASLSDPTGHLDVSNRAALQAGHARGVQALAHCQALQHGKTRLASNPGRRDSLRHGAAIIARGVEAAQCLLARPQIIGDLRAPRIQLSPVGAVYRCPLDVDGM